MAKLSIVASFLSITFLIACASGLQAEASSASKTVVISWGRDQAASENINEKVTVGTTVQWVWADSYPHSVIGYNDLASAAFTGQGSGYEVVTQKGFKYTYKFTEAGTYEFGCYIHSNMGGKIVVVNKASSPPPKKRSPPPKRRSPPPKRRSPPPKRRSPPPKRRSPPPKRRSPPPKRRSPPPKRRSPPPKRRSPPPKRRSPPPKRRSPPPKRRSPPPKRRSPPPKRAQSPPPSANPVVIPWGVGVTASSNINKKIKVGTTVQWVWADDFPHSVFGENDLSTAEFSGEGSGSSIVTQKGFKYSHKFTKVGTYTFSCFIHSNLGGQIVVVQ